MQRVVLDTDVLVAALRSRTGASRILLEWAEQERFRVLVSASLILEYEAVLSRPDQVAATGLAPPLVRRFLQSMSLFAEPVCVHFQWRPMAPDAGDDHILETAINGRADFLVTFNIRHLMRPAARFGIRAVRPAEFLERSR